MAYEKEDQGDENEFVHFEEEELGGDPEEVIEEETEEELVITERPGGAGAPQAPSAPKPAATFAAFAPTIPPPRIVIWAGATPGTPPNRIPRPICGRSRYLAPS